MTARRNARAAVAVEAHVRFRGVKWQVITLSGQTLHLVGLDGGGEAVLAGYPFADPASASSAPAYRRRPRSGGCLKPHLPRRGRGPWPGSDT